jgi:Mrp family chromosome partitioning ATPase
VKLAPVRPWWPVAQEGGGTQVALPGELPPGDLGAPSLAPGLLTLDQAMMRGVATRAMAAGAAGLTAVGVASLRHGEGATTVARGLAACLAQSFGKRVVLVEANQRSACMRAAYGLPDGPGLGDVLARRVSLGGALQLGGEHRQVVVLPASVQPMGVIGAADLRELLVELLGYVDAAVVDLAPVLPYRDTVDVCSALDGVALVMRGGSSTVSDGRAAVQRVQAAGGSVLGGVLNRERVVVPRFVERWLRRAG